MELNVFTANNLRTLGERVNEKKCFEARDEHFTCLDHFDDRYDNHYKCKSTFELWKKNCDDGLRNLHMVERDRERINNKLYTPEQLADYNKRKNVKVYFSPNAL